MTKEIIMGYFYLFNVSSALERVGGCPRDETPIFLQELRSNQIDGVVCFEQLKNNLIYYVICVFQYLPVWSKATF